MTGVTLHRMTGVTLHRMTGVTLHGVLAPDGVHWAHKKDKVCRIACRSPRGLHGCQVEIPRITMLVSTILLSTRTWQLEVRAGGKVTS